MNEIEQWENAAAGHFDRAKAAEAKLREAVEVIRKLRDCFGLVAGANTDSASAYAELEADERARAFLATIKDLLGD